MAKDPLDYEKVLRRVLEYHRADYGTYARINEPPDWMLRCVQAPPHAIRRLRGFYRDNQTCFAARIGVTPQTLSAWESGYSVPSEQFIHRLQELDAAKPAAQEHEATPEQIKALRLLGKETQAQFAAALGVSRVTVARWESGQSRPEGANLEQLSDLIKLLL